MLILTVTAREGGVGELGEGWRDEVVLVTTDIIPNLVFDMPCCYVCIKFNKQIGKKTTKKTICKRM